MKKQVYTFEVDRKYECIRFENTYWFPIENFNQFNANISSGLFHLSKKGWIDDSLLEKICVFCEKEFPDSDFRTTIGYIKQRRKDVAELFKSMGNG